MQAKEPLKDSKTAKVTFEGLLEPQIPLNKERGAFESDQDSNKQGDQELHVVYGSDDSFDEALTKVREIPLAQYLGDEQVKTI